MKINIKIPNKINIGKIKVSNPNYVLPKATKETLGGIKVGKNLTIDEDGTLNAQAGGNSGIVEESDPTVPAHVKAITQEDIDNWNKGTGGESSSDGIVVENDVITVTNKELSVASSSAYSDFELVEKCKIGNSFSIENNAIKIGKGVSKVLLSFGAMLMYPGDSGLKYIRIRKNNALQFQTQQNVNKEERALMVHPTVLMEVAEGDLIDMGAYGSQGDYYYSDRGFITIQKVDETTVIGGGGTGNIDLTDYAKKSELPTKTSQLTNDSNFINSIKTINGQSLEGEGNIVIESGSGENSGASNVVVSPTEPINGEEVWFQKKVNLFNKNATTKNARIIDTGKILTGETDAYASDFIKVEPNTQYTIQGSTYESGITRPWYNCYYDVDKQVIDSYTTKEGTYTITTPENAYYMRFTIHKNDLNQFQVEKGSIASAYLEYVENEIYTKNSDGEYEKYDMKIEEDTGWIDATLTSHFKLYNEYTYCRYRKIGGMVNIQFVLSPTSANNTLNTSTGQMTAFSVPESFRPKSNVVTLCQGSSTNIFITEVTASGEVTIGRYRNGASYNSTPPATTAWLNANIIYFCG